MFLNNEDLSFKYIIRKPKKSKDNYSLFLMIHGYGSNEKDLFSITKDIPENFCVISIQGNYSIEKGKYFWYHIDFSNKEKFVHVLQAEKTIEKINHFINEVINKYQLNNNNVWLCGFSQGAILCYAISLENIKVKKSIILSGYLERKIIKKNSILNKNLEFFISHGKNDLIIPISWAKKSLNILKKKGIYSYSFKEYDSGHFLCNSNYEDLINWIKEKNF
ncbi:alpha/beta hydrolase [Blattabacterium cuenoti]|uniref:alpha/beta hydrolase n=1 Tax=Blattabacterium cuenoti TaxID=1653831 RepID=UPI00163D0EE7|nr:phospholipase [Blattabacterium cuenoti]